MYSIEKLQREAHLTILLSILQFLVLDDVRMHKNIDEKSEEEGDTVRDKKRHDLREHSGDCASTFIIGFCIA